MANKNEFELFSVFTGLFVASLIISNVTAPKIVDFGWLQISGATIIFPLSFIFGDILTEVYGYARSRRVIWTGFAAVILLAVSTWIIKVLPPAALWQDQAAFEVIFGLTPRIALASITAYWAGEFCNSFVVSKMKYLVKGKRGGSQAWRFIASTIVGEGVDSIVFMTVAFVGVLPSAAIIQTIIGIYIFKVAYEIIATPFSTRFANWVKKVEGIDQIDYPERINYNPFSVFSK
ncbi:MAG: queuosine precursor transporter [Candidatus Andersenbacteria bacterium]|nr:queuosine precursor transporter [Candidatus Andersenbacteria bacterium]MBI3250844.1 queuosine precursor transporter [Candidatus Andersenbacteria bacterium]